MKRILLLLAGMAIVIGFIIIRNNFLSDENNQKIIPPYYQKKVFTLPQSRQGKLKSATVAAELKIPILLYHYVEYVKDLKDFIRMRQNITPNIFENQLKTLKNASYQTLFVKDIADIIDHKEELPKKPIALTFDDGYEDFYTVVFPLLKKYQMKATNYVVADFLGKPNFMNKAQVRQLHESGLVEIASHSLNHLSLTMVAKKIATEEIRDSKTKIEVVIDGPVYDFAYPYGDFNETLEQMVKKTGYLSAASVITGVTQSKTNRFFLSRLRPGRKVGRDLLEWLEKL